MNLKLLTELVYTVLISCTALGALDCYLWKLSDIRGYPKTLKASLWFSGFYRFLKYRKGRTYYMERILKPTRKAKKELEKYDIETNPPGWYR